MAVDKIQKLIAEGSVKQLVAGVEASQRLIRDIKSILKKSEANAEVAKWMESLDKLEKQNIHKRTVVGVFGNTGAGKSSLINAVLGEEALLDTSGLWACTSAVTELLWNETEDPRKRYTAEVHFITAEEWTAELRLLFDEVAESPLELQELKEGKTDAAVAFQKVRAVYPHIPDSDIVKGQFDVDSLASGAGVKEVLGTTKCFFAETTQSLQAQLQPLLKPQRGNTITSVKEQDSSSMLLWPLIKVVQIFARSPVLENGLVLVDLPGLQDSNAARTAVAEKYKEQCSGYWIASPMIRATDDKEAKKLMGEAFKRQLHFDGGFSNVTIIHTKSDDFLVTEAVKDLRGVWKVKVDDIMSQIEDAETLIREKVTAISDVKDKIRAAELIHSDNMKRLQEANRRLLAPEGLRMSPRKRRLSDGDLPETKRISLSPDRASPVSSSTPAIDTKMDGGSLYIVSQTADLKSEFDRLQQENARQRQALDELKKQLKALETERKELKPKVESLKMQKKTLCIRFRNDVSRRRAKEQYINDIKELDEDMAAEAEGDNFDPSQDRRDYKELAKQVQVFCVSSRAYLKLLGKLRQDEDITGFEAAEDTEIPKLKTLATGLAEKMLSTSCRHFLSDMSQVLRSLTLRVKTLEEPLTLAANQKRSESRALNKNLESLKTDFEKAETALMDGLKMCEDSVLHPLHFGCGMCKEQAPFIVAGWFAPAQKKGIPYRRFVTICKGEGLDRKNNFNLHHSLYAPLMKHIGICWDDVFRKQIFKALEKFGQTAAQTLEGFRGSMEGRDKLSQSDMSLDAFSDLVIGYMQNLRDINSHKKVIQESYRAAIRSITPIIAAVMLPVYRRCLKETGSGCFKRMREIIEAHVAANEDMYAAVAEEVEARIKKLNLNLVKTIHANNERILDDIRGRFTELVKGKSRMSKSLKETLSQLGDMLARVDTHYDGILVSMSKKTGKTDIADGDIPKKKLVTVKEDDDE